jgi:hypothetical protein
MFPHILDPSENKRESLYSRSRLNEVVEETAVEKVTLVGKHQLSEKQPSMLSELASTRRLM